MAEHFLYYCPWHNIVKGNQPDSPDYFYAASDQFARMRLKEGDTIWHVSLRPRGSGEPEEFLLRGRLIVGCITDDREQVCQRTKGYVHDAAWHAFAREGTIERYSNEVNIDDLAPALRFQSTRDRFDLVHGRLTGQHLQAMRRLTPESAALLRDRWEQRPDAPATPTTRASGTPAVHDHDTPRPHS